MGFVEQFAEYLGSCYGTMPVPIVPLAEADSDLAARLEPAPAAVVVGPATVEQTLVRRGLRASFVGWTPAGERLAVLDEHAARRPAAAPPGFRVVAILPVFNEADVIAGTLQYLVDDGIGVYVIDNWSTDGTAAIVRQFAGRGLVGLERFPAQHDSGIYDLRGILGRVEAVASGLDADWVVLHDADERRRTPWRDVGLRDALYHADRAGFTCIDHVTLNFSPVDDGYDPARDLEAYFPYFQFSDHPGHFHQRRAWKQPGTRVSLAPTAGHDVAFAGRRVYPYKFLLKHYPIRSHDHGRRKVVQERRARFDPAERALGWHQQYEHLDSFVRRPAELEYFDPDVFYEQRLLERLSGVGVFAQPPHWATPPMWTAREPAGQAERS